MAMAIYLIVGFIGFVFFAWLSMKAKFYTNQLIFKEQVEEYSPKSFIGDLVSLGIFSAYCIIAYEYMPR